MRRHPAWLFAPFFLLAWIAAAPAAGEMEFVAFRPCAGESARCMQRVLVQGKIELDADVRLAAFIEDRDAHTPPLPGKPLICFNSPGGNVGGALKLGSFIRERGLETCLAPSYSRVERDAAEPVVFVSRATCASACAFAILGGRTRQIEGGSRYGLHQFSGRDGEFGDGATQKTIVTLARYVERMGVDRRLLDIASLVTPPQVRWLTTAELAALRVTGVTAGSAPWQLDALKDGTVFARTQSRRPGSQDLVVMVILREPSAKRAVLVLSVARAASAAQAPDSAAEAPQGEDLVITVDDVAVLRSPNQQWKKGARTVTTIVNLEDEALAALRTGRTFRLSRLPAGGQAASELLVDSELTGLQRLLPAVLK